MASRTKSKKIERAIIALEKLYKEIPETKGCLECIEKDKSEGGCGAWCCSKQNAQVLYCEFIRTWKYILDYWSSEQIADLIEVAMENYVSSLPTKGCIFWDKETKLCKQHKSRCYNCFLYGITPEEEFRPRYKKLKAFYKDNPLAVIKDQCKLISTINGKEITKSRTTVWWKRLIEIERSLGIKKKDISDKPGGSYLTYHDHLLLQVCSDVIMQQLQMLRVYATDIEKYVAIKGIMDGFRKKMREIPIKEFVANDEHQHEIPVAQSPS